MLKFISKLQQLFKKESEREKDLGWGGVWWGCQIGYIITTRTWVNMKPHFTSPYSLGK